MVPKKQFTFSLRKKESTKDQAEEEEEEDTDAPSNPSVAEKGKVVQTSKISGFSDRKNETLNLLAQKVELEDIQLSNLDCCKVYIPGCCSNVRISKLTNSQLVQHYELYGVRINVTSYWYP